MRPSRFAGSLTAAGLLVGLLAAPAPSQTHPRSPSPDPEDARRLYQEARRVEATGDRSMQLTAAWLYREAARLWPKTHEKRYRSLWRAAHLYLHHGRTSVAAALFAEAGAHARRSGRPKRAARCQLRLARLAAELGHEHRARRALNTARRQLDETKLEEKEREHFQEMQANVRRMITRLVKSKI